MAFYSDYTVIVPYDTSIIITKAAVSNAIADLLVAHAGFTLVGHATEGAASSATNYAKVSWHNLSIIIYDTNTSTLGKMSFYLYFTDGTSTAYSKTITFPSVASTSVTVTLRFFNPLSGVYVRYFSSSSAWATIVLGLELSRISDNNSFYGLALGETYVDSIATDDGSNTIYLPPNAATGGKYDVNATTQILTPLLIGTSYTSYAKVFLASNCYAASAFIMEGFVKINSRYFFISGDG